MDLFEKYNIPRKCPICGAEVKINDSGFPYCPNPECSQKLFHRFERFFNVLDIKGAGKSFIDALVEKDINVLKFVNLCKRNDIDTLCKCAGGINGEKILNNTLKALSAPVSVSKFFAMFDYDGFDAKKLSVLDKYTVEKCLTLSYDDIISFDGFADITAKKLLYFFSTYKDEILDYKKAFIFKEKTNDTNKKLTGLSFCFTGKACKPRAELQKIVEDNGGKNLDSVTKNLSYLVTDDTESGSSKNKKAKELNIKIITSEDFLKMI
jgi:DNA ligase (NAD+)